MIENIINDHLIINDTVITELNKYMKNRIEIGTVYCLHNEMFKYYGDDVYKIGMSTNTKRRVTDYTTSYIGPGGLRNKFLNLQSNVTSRLRIA
jgi:hypothetical protein